MLRVAAVSDKMVSYYRRMGYDATECLPRGLHTYLLLPWVACDMYDMFNYVIIYVHVPHEVGLTLLVKQLQRQIVFLLRLLQASLYKVLDLQQVQFGHPVKKQMHGDTICNKFKIDHLSLPRESKTVNILINSIFDFSLYSNQ